MPASVQAEAAAPRAFPLARLQCAFVWISHRPSKSDAVSSFVLATTRRLRMTRQFVLALGLILGGCATTHVTAFRDPAFSGRQYSHLAVFVLGTSLAARQDLEQRICKGVAPTGCSMGVSVLPPVRDYTADEMGAYIHQSGADAVLILTAGADRSHSGVAGYYSLSNGQATTTANTSGTINTYGNTGTYQGTTNAETYSTGQTTTLPI